MLNSKKNGNISGIYPLRMILQYHQIFGQSFVPGIHTYVPHDSRYYRIITNNIGMRSCRNYSLDKPEGKRRIVVFGDSFTAGEGVDNGERFTDLIEQRHNNLEVLNFALPGTGTGQQLLIYENLGKNFSADLLLVCPLVENINRIAHKYRPVIERTTGQIVIVAKPYFTLEYGQLRLHNVPVPRLRWPINDAPGEVLADTDFSGRFVQLRKFINSYFLPLKNTFMKLFKFNPYPQYVQTHPHWILMKALLKRFIDQRQDKKVVIAPLPTYHYIEGISKPDYWQVFEDFGKDNPGIHMINILPYFNRLNRRQKKGCRFTKDIHYTSFAHSVVADALSSELKLHKLI